MTKYRSRLVTLHSHSSYDTTMYFDAVLNEEAKQGWRVVNGFRLNENIYLLIFERIEA